MARSDKYDDGRKEQIARCNARKTARRKARKRMNAHLRQTGQKFGIKDAAFDNSKRHQNVVDSSCNDNS